MGASHKVKSACLRAVTLLMAMGLASHASAGDRFFVSDKGAKQVFKYNETFSPTIDWATATENGAPDDIFVTGSEVYVLDASAKKVFRYDFSGNSAVASLLLKVPGSSTSADIGTPMGMSVDPQTDELWITDQTRIYRYSLSGAFASGTSVNALNQYNLHTSNSKPQGLTLDAQYAYVLDFEQTRLYRYLRSNPAAGFTPSRKFRTQAGVKLTKPEGVAVAGDLVYVLNNDSANTVYLYSLVNLFIDPTDENASASYALAAGNSDPFGIGIDKTKHVVSITPSTVGPTNLDSISFDVVFDQAMLNFNDAADLVITHNGTANTGVTVTGSGSTYTVSVDGLSGDGTFTLGVNTASDVVNLGGDGLVYSVTSPAVLIDNTAPRADLLTPLNGSQLDVTFTELNGMSTGTLEAAAYTASGPGLGTLNPTPSSVTNMGNNVYRLGWDQGGSINGLMLTIAVDPALTDLAGNPIDNSAMAPSVIALPVSLSGFTIE